MAQFTVNINRLDPYRNFKCRVLVDGAVVAGVSKVSALTRTTEMVTHRDGADPSSTRKSPGQTTYEPIPLERGVTHDIEFGDWANKVWTHGRGRSGDEVSLADFRKDIRIELPELDANANEVAIETIVLEHEGWQRDEAVTGPTEPSF